MEMSTGKARVTITIEPADGSEPVSLTFPQVADLVMRVNEMEREATPRSIIDEADALKRLGLDWPGFAFHLRGDVEASTQAPAYILATDPRQP